MVAVETVAFPVELPVEAVRFPVEIFSQNFSAEFFSCNTCRAYKLTQSLIPCRDSYIYDKA